MFKSTFDDGTRKMIRKLFALSILSLLTGCASISYITETYNEAKLVEVAMPDDTYRIFDNPKISKIMVTSSIGSALGQGLGKGLTLGAAETIPPRPKFQAAAEKFLADDGRKNCKIKDGYLLISPQFEFIYDCGKKK